MKFALFPKYDYEKEEIVVIFSFSPDVSDLAHLNQESSKDYNSDHLGSFSTGKKKKKRRHR